MAASSDSGRPGMAGGVDGADAMRRAVATAAERTDAPRHRCELLLIISSACGYARRRRAVRRTYLTLLAEGGAGVLTAAQRASVHYRFLLGVPTPEQRPDLDAEQVDAPRRMRTRTRRLRAAAATSPGRDVAPGGAQRPALRGRARVVRHRLAQDRRVLALERRHPRVPLLGACRRAQHHHQHVMRRPPSHRVMDARPSVRPHAPW